MKIVHQAIVSSIPLTRLPSIIKGSVLFSSALLTGALLLTGCQSTSLSQSNAITAKHTPAAAKKALATALQKQRRQSFSYHANLEISNDQQFTNINAKNLVGSDDIYDYCEDTHDQAYAALVTQAETQNKDIEAASYDTQRTALKQSYLECAAAYQAWEDNPYDSNINVSSHYQQLFDNYDNKSTPKDIKKTQLLDAYLLKPLSINSQGVYQPMAGKATMLASVQYQARNHQSSINQPIYVDFKNGNIYLWADNFAMLNSEMLDDKLGTKWRNKWLKIVINDGTLPKGFGNELIKSHFAALDTTFDSASISQFDYVVPNTLASLTPKLPTHQLSATLASDEVIRRVQSAASYEQFYQDYMRIFYDRITKKYPELVKDNKTYQATTASSDKFTSKALVQQMLAMIKGRIDSEVETSEAEIEVRSTVQELYGFDKRGRLKWQHLRSEFANKTNSDKNMVMDILQQYSAIRPQDKAFPNLPSDMQVPNVINSVDVREYGDELMQYYRDGNGTAMGKMVFDMLPMAKERLGSID
ncbi:hypothetical protein AAIR29_04950 [Psychrobacter sp. FBL11]|uniref:Lipoprotein n=1 Tax=Psychrobacter saeujeotis TaxID=3143436 RepID=A0ABU9X6E1_9GAMM|nr:hypothetical protein [uncultured Psychrobacter sp.]